MKKQLIDRDLVQDKICQNTYNALKCLIDNSYYSQLTAKHNSPSLTRHNIQGAAYFNEFCTIRMCSSRQCGHTTALCRIAQEYFSKVAILSPRTDMSKRILNCFGKDYVPSMPVYSITHDQITTKDGYYIFGTYTDVNSMYRFCGHELEAIFVDGTFDLTKEKENMIKDSLYPCMANYPQKFFVFIQ